MQQLAPILHELSLPNLDHSSGMTDDTGLVQQHAMAVPTTRGICDRLANGRALIAAAPAEPAR